MRAEQEEPDAFAALAFDEFREAACAFGAAHFACCVATTNLVGATAGAEDVVVSPVGDNRLVMAGFALSDFVFVMREDQVEAAAMDIERFAEQLLPHGGAFDMRPWPAVPPGAFPGGLASLRTLPQRKVCGMPLALTHRTTFALHGFN